MRNSLFFFGMLLLLACGDPLADFEQIEDVELVPDEPIAQALPDTDDITPVEGLFSRLLKRKNDAQIEQVDTNLTPDEQQGAEITTVAETDDLVEVSSIDPVIALESKEEQKPNRLVSWLRRASADKSQEKLETEETNEIGENREESTDDTSIVIAEANNESASAIEDVIDDDEILTASIGNNDKNDLVEPKKRRGLFSGLLKPNPDAPETIKVASLDDGAQNKTSEQSSSNLAEPQKRKSLFGSGGQKEVRVGPDARDVEFGTVLPYGEVARVCGVKHENKLGRRLDQAPAPGVGYSLFDSDPQSTEPRTFYVTGFRDNCPRQFTASLALFGSPKVHEQLRYGRPSKLYPYSTTDKAYEKVKSAVCKVGKNKPCGSKIISLERTTVFVSTYENFTDNARWADILIHDGTVLAAAIKTP